MKHRRFQFSADIDCRLSCAAIQRYTMRTWPDEPMTRAEAEALAQGLADVAPVLDKPGGRAMTEFNTSVVAKTIRTPVGRLKAPLHPLFAKRLSGCTCNADLFALVCPRNYVDPDALNEVEARGLMGAYAEWLGDD